ncbi:hypothetical protein P43SY_000812 [Pythium insidiosum]|uniref:Magnesium transporter n=1 Tax=Pythium insidiosum TaxID=114742 RepID=A0AAD5LL85_PYTIN|nr:hypothetical protein P43SY_000812 [Pythium insidiosum]
MAFEFRILEAILFTICKVLLHLCAKKFPPVMSAVERLATVQISPEELETLRTMKNTINDISSQVEGIRHVLTELIDNEDDLRLLYLSKLYNDPDVMVTTKQFDPEEAEALLESYLQEIHMIRTRIRLLQNRIQNTESLVMLKLDSTRNHLLTVDVIFSLLTVSLTFGMFVTAAFGMNLQSGVETHPSAFVLVLVGAFVICALIIVAGLIYFRKKGVWAW